MILNKNVLFIAENLYNAPLLSGKNTNFAPIIHAKVIRKDKMKKLLTIFFSLMAVTAVSAQNAKFGKPTQEEWDLTSVSFAPDADAVVLYKSVDVSYKVSGAFNASGSSGDGSLDDNGVANMGVNKYYNPEGTNMLYNVKVRTKILKDSGKGYASLDIISYKNEDDLNMVDEFYEMSVVVFSNVDGKVKKKKLSASSFKDERIDKYYCIRHVRIPDVKVGDIVEYQYQLFSQRITYIFDTQLQESIPVLYSKCRMEIPFFLQFIVNKPEIPNVAAGVQRTNILMPSPNNDGQLPRKCAANEYVIEARQLPAYDGEVNLENLSSGKVYCVRTEIKDKRFDVKEDVAGPVRHLIIGK